MTVTVKEMNWDRLLKEIKEHRNSRGEIDRQTMRDRLESRPQDVRLIRQLAIYWMHSEWFDNHLGNTDTWDLITVLPPRQVPKGLVRQYLTGIVEHRFSRFVWEGQAIKLAAEICDLLGQSLTCEDFMNLVEITPTAYTSLGKSLLSPDDMELVRLAAVNKLIDNTVQSHQHTGHWYMSCPDWQKCLDDLIELIHSLENPETRPAALAQISQRITNQRTRRALRRRLHRLLDQGRAPATTTSDMIFALGGHLAA